MKRVIASLAVAATLLLASCSEPLPPAKPAMWEIKGPTGERGWLFGTVHAMPSDTAWRTEAFKNAFASARILVVEAAGIADPDESRVILDRLATTRDLPPLDQRIDPSHREALAKLLAEHDVDPASFKDVETWAVALSLAQYDDFGDPAYAADRVLLEQSFGKTLAEFEGVEAQLSLFDKLPEEDQRQLLAAVVDEAVQGEELAEARFRQWLAGDADAIAKGADQGLLADPELRSVLLVERNRAWTVRIVKLLGRKQPLFVAVGTAHLAGPDGLVALLQQQGLTVTRIQ